MAGQIPAPSSQQSSSSSTSLYSQSGDQVDQVLDQVFADLENSLGSDPLPEPLELDEYPYATARPPLRSRRPQYPGWLLMGSMMVAAVLSGVAFWISSQPQPASVSMSTDSDPGVIADTGFPQDEPDLDLSQFEMDLLGDKQGAEVSTADPAEVATAEPQQEPPTAAPPSGTPNSVPSSSGSSSSVSSGPVATASSSATPAPAPVSAPTLSQPLPRSAPQMKLVGIVHEPGDPLALILVGGVVRQVPVGHAVQTGWQVTSIAPQGVGISNGRNRYLLQLGLGQVL